MLPTDFNFPAQVVRINRFINIFQTCDRNSLLPPVAPAMLITTFARPRNLFALTDQEVAVVPGIYPAVAWLSPSARHSDVSIRHSRDYG
jgi:hypothetical protein